MSYRIEDIIDFVEKVSFRKKVKADSDLEKEIGIYGDDFYEMIEEFSIKFNVDISNFLWYFHSGKEGAIIRFVKPPNKKVKRIPVTPLMLLDFANKGKWDIEYPPHNKSIVENRVDEYYNFFILISIPIFFAFLFVMAKILLK